MRFNEIAELAKPSSKVRRQTIIKDKGTNVAHRVIQFQWTTKIGNVIKLMFEPKGDDTYSVMFYVNDVLYDFASRKGEFNDVAGKQTFSGDMRDIEILGNVFYLMKLKANQLHAKQLNFRAHQGEKDERVVTGLDPEQYKKLIPSLIAKLKRDINEPEFIPPNDTIIGLYKKLNKPVPDQVPHKVHSLLKSIEERVGKNEEIDDLIYPLENQYPNHELAQVLKRYNDAVKSNTPMGLVIKRNRRKNVYKRIVERYFADEWNISIKGDYFELTRI